MSNELCDAGTIGQFPKTFACSIKSFERKTMPDRLDTCKYQYSSFGVFHLRANTLCGTPKVMGHFSALQCNAERPSGPYIGL